MHNAQMSRLFVLACGLFGLAAPVIAEDAVVLNPASAVTTLTDDQFKDLFLGKKLAWDDGTKVIVVVVKDGPANEALMKRLGKNPQQFQTGWKKLVFTGKGSMPEQVDNEDALVAFVAKTPGSIGVIDKSKAKDSVKAIAAP
jgi:ABC-type phosphate transport system substrate-binding protein